MNNNTGWSKASTNFSSSLSCTDVPDVVDVKDLSAADAIVQLQARLDSRPAAAAGTGSRRSGHGRNTFRVLTVDSKAEDSAEAKVGQNPVSLMLGHSTATKPSSCAEMSMPS